ncbi:MAG: thioesterase family protein [Bacteroidales bacterium]|nr:thioesterase family protein [Tenuifilaceae bacterium]
MSHSFNHILPLQTRFGDIDSLGHTNNTVYLQYIDLGRLHYLIDVLQERMDWENQGLIVVNVNINFLSQVKMFDEVEVRTKVVKLGNKSLEMFHQIYNKTANVVAVEGKSVMAGYSNKIGASIPIPARWRERIIAFEKEVEV